MQKKTSPLVAVVPVPVLLLLPTCPTVILPIALLKLSTANMEND